MKAEDYLELPEYIEDIVPVALDDKAKRAYAKLEREMLLEVDEQTVTAGTGRGAEWKAAAALQRRRL